MTATDYDFQSTRADIIQRAFRIVGAIGSSGVLTGDKISQGAQALNDLVKAWQNRRIFLWTIKFGSQALSASTASYALSSDPAIIGIDRAYLRLSSTDLPVRVISFREYQDIPNKTDPGDPTHCAIDNASAPTMYVYPVPTGSRTMYLNAITKLKDFDSSSATADFPSRWGMALTYGLADQLKDEYGLSISEREYIESQAKKFFKEAAAADRERVDYEFVAGAFD